LQQQASFKKKRFLKIRIMKLLEKILMPIDVNKDYSAQLNAAIKLAKEFNSEVAVMYVLPDSEVHPEIQNLLDKYINETLNEAIDALKGKKITCSSPIIETGNPVDKILQVANDQNVNLILACSGTKAKDDDFKLGTTAEKLIQLSDVPVWVAKSEDKSDFKRILCPVDFSDPSKRALRNAILLTNNLHAELTILAVYEPFFNTSLRLQIDEKAENEKLFKQFEEQLEQFLGEFDLRRVNHNVDVQKGTAHLTILETLDKNEVDLLVMGTNGRSGFSRMLMGSVTEKVIRELPCSFVTTKTQNIFKLKFDNEIKEIEIHFKNAEKLEKSGLYEEAIEQCLICLQINDMHVPSMYKLSNLHKVLGNDDKVEYYDKMATKLLQRLWDKKIEFEIRQHYKPKI
jgi:nucleotide-binding universal stress UspA family protein